MAFPGTYLNLTVELALGADLTDDPSGWDWTDVTAYVRARDLVTITRGGYDGSTQAPPSKCELVVDNSDGRWVPTNPNGAWYGQMKVNTPIRVLVDEGTESVRWTGFLSSLPPRWNDKETDRYVAVQASGIMQRLQRGSTPLRSAIVRSLSGTSTPPVRYWPAEDGAGATSFAEYFGNDSMKFTGGVITPASDGPDGSLPLPEFTTAGGCMGRIPHRPPTGGWSVACIINFPSAPSADGTAILRWYTSGSLPMWQVVLNPSATPDAWELQGYDVAGALQVSASADFTSNADSSVLYGQWVLIVASATQDGTGIVPQAWVFTAAGGRGAVPGTVSSQTVGAVVQIGVVSSTKLNGMHAGHWAIWDYDVDISVTVEPNWSAIDGHDDELASMRAERLGTEEGVAVDIDSLSSEPGTQMGPQGASTFLDLLRECEAVGAGRLYENLDPVANDRFIRFKHSEDLANLDVALTLNHDSGHLSLPFDPTDDDQNLRNDWTATRDSASGTGSSARVIATAGEHSSLTPSVVGTYADSVSVNVYTDDQLPHQAGWRVNVGTVDGLRFPVVTLDLARNPSLIDDWIGCDIGSRITITNPPTGIAPDDIDLLIEGWAETLGPKEWRVNINCSPYGPWRVFQLAETSSDTDPFLGRLAGDEKCALRVAIDDNDTSILVDPNYYRWTTAADDFPLSIRLGGEVVTLSGIATTAATFVSAGTATHADNASVTPGFPAGTGPNNILFVLAAIRSSGTGTVNTPTGYTRLPVFASDANVQLFAKVDGGSEVAPSVSFTGGSAGDTTSAVMFAFDRLPVSLDDLGDIVVGQIVQLNASAANIAYGGLYVPQYFGSVQLVVGWKQDDYTSVAPPSGFTELLEASSTTGSDQSLYVAYRIDTTPVVTPEGSLAVTGGASAISRSAVVALAGGYQTFTASARSVNGVTKSHAVGTLVAVEDPAVLAL